ncbi:MAG TPA: hypothetical protein VEK36_01370 [Candidatus Paceibacterota bacterium]|nr:hypothetical protein [Candidatus Paceibacterota bacterium]
MIPIGNDTGLDILRYVVALIFLYHGLRAIMKPGGASTWKMSTGIYMVMGVVEILSSAGLFINRQVFLAATLLSLVSVSFIYTKVFKIRVGFSSSHGSGWQFDLLLLAANFALLFANLPR